MSLLYTAQATANIKVFKNFYYPINIYKMATINKKVLISLAGLLRQR